MNKENNNEYLFIGGYLDGQRIKIPNFTETYLSPWGDYHLEQVLGKDKYFFFFLHETSELNDGLEILFKKYGGI
jgi:hypothetical protein